MIDLSIILIGGVVLAWLAIVVLALFDIWQTSELTDLGRLGWTLAAVFAPVLGTILWFVTRPRRSAPEAATSGSRSNREAE